jgi:hypothetical protein
MRFTEAEDNYIREHYLSIPTKRISKNLGRSESSARQRMILLGLTIPKHISDGFKAQSHYKKGRTPENKGKKQSEFMSAEAIARTAATRFSKGNEPHNTKHDGYERITKDGYVEIRITKGKFKLKHRHEWEAVNGTIPKGHMLVCLTEDKTNTAPTNWQLISRVEGMNRNSAAVNLPDVAVATYLAKKGHSTDKQLRSAILAIPELITAKRTQLLINRKIKHHGKEQNI